MAHHRRYSGYKRLVDRINRFPQGAPPSRLLFEILKHLLDEKEAGRLSLLPIRPFTAQRAAKIWKTDRVKTRKILDRFSSRALLLDIEQNGTSFYILPPPMAGFFEFSMMRVRSDVNQKLLSELYYQYLNVEEAFIRELFTVGETQLGRTFVHEPALSDENALHVLDYERATHVIKEAGYMGISTCYCRHKMYHMKRACAAPMEICMTFNSTAQSLIKHGFATRVEAAQGLEYLAQAYENNLVQFGENVRNSVNFICNCCGCCCEAMIAARKFAILNPVHTTNFIPEVSWKDCNGCGKCVAVCPVEAMVLVSANLAEKPKRKKAKPDIRRCLGCGVCVRVCSNNCIVLVSRSKRVLTPMDGIHRTVVMAIERGKLQNLIFDNHALFSHRAMAAVLGVILKLPPIQKAMAMDQVKSRYLEALIDRMAL